MNLDQIKNVYFIGIGGIGMSALARYFRHLGKNVTGYDKTPTHLTDELGDDGIDIHFEESIDLIPKDFLPDNTLVITTPAVPITHAEWNWFIEREYEVKKRAEVLGIITRDTFCFAVAGTHGKTTTSAILGHILHQSGADVTAFVGGIVENYQTNLIGKGKTITVVEADEFDRSFLHLHPDIACVTSMDADHLDIYGDKSAIEDSFREFASRVEERENLFVAGSLPLDGNKITLEGDGDYRAQNIRLEQGHYVFDVQCPDRLIKELLLADIKYILGHNPLLPAYDPENSIESTYATSAHEIVMDEGIYAIGHPGNGFCFDNELSRHRVFLEPYSVQSELVTNGEYLEFVASGGYREFRFWLAEGWEWVKSNAATAPLYWHDIEGKWHQYSLAGLTPLDLEAPVSHVNYFEASAYAAWRGKRLPTEFEWEAASPHFNWGRRWEWTSSAYLPYPGFSTAPGALGEYNGKFMVNQMVLRGGSIATPPGHTRNTYRNFFHPHLRWQFTGIRLAE